jgi:hypothetical protein
LGDAVPHEDDGAGSDVLRGEAFAHTGGLQTPQRRSVGNDVRVGNDAAVLLHGAFLFQKLHVAEVQDTSDEGEDVVLLLWSELEDIEGVLKEVRGVERKTEGGRGGFGHLHIIELLLVRHALDVNDATLAGEVEELGVLELHAGLKLLIGVTCGQELIKDMVVSFSSLGDGEGGREMKDEPLGRQHETSRGGS